jgi:carotenoid 1,2-hydratase
VFSPYYAWSGRGDPEAHCAVNIALYRRRKHLWAMTERGRADVQRDAHALRIGPSRAHRDGALLHLDIDELSTPIPSRMRGSIAVDLSHMFSETYALDPEGRHRWRPIAPNAKIEVRLTRPNVAWTGRAYVDCNWGAEPPERAFSHWNWSRAHLADHRSIVHYDVVLKSGLARSTSLRFGASGAAEPILNPPRTTTLRSTLWKLARKARGGDEPAVLVRTLEDTPFYARSWLRAPIDGVQADIFHESLSLTRLTSPLVRAMLPFRMPRRSGG